MVSGTFTLRHSSLLVLGTCFSVAFNFAKETHFKNQPLCQIR